MEVIKIEPIFNTESHHFILYKFEDNTAQNYDEGMRDAEEGEGSMFDSGIVAAWQNTNAIELPPTTAYSWASDDVLDMNYHLLNYSQDSILAADVYLNVYTQPTGVAAHEMHSQLLPIDWFTTATGGAIGPSLIIPNDGQPHRFSEAFFGPMLGLNWYVWSLGSHTHARGTDFDIYLREFNGSRGDQIYEGFYNTDYTFNQGFYDWEHPPVRYFDPLFDINMLSGIIFEAEYVNNGPDTLFWGSTTKDEMMLIFVQFTDAQLTGIEEAGGADQAWLQVAPNPFRDQTRVAFNLNESTEVSLRVLDLMGREITTLTQGLQGPGVHEYTFHQPGISNGIYLVELELDGRRITKKILKN